MFVLTPGNNRRYQHDYNHKRWRFRTRAASRTPRKIFLLQAVSQTPAVKQSNNTTIPRDTDGNNQIDDEQSQVPKSIDAEKLKLTRLMMNSLLAERATNPAKINQYHTLQWWRSKEIS